MSSEERGSRLLGIRNTHASGKDHSKELQRLSRQDLLELLVSQLREGDELRLAVERLEHDIQERDGLVERLKARLDLKDEKIATLRDRLDDKDAKIAHLKDRLDDKDATLGRLKRRLDTKDDLIARVAEAGGVDPMAIGICEAQQRSGEATGGESDKNEHEQHEQRK